MGFVSKSSTNKDLENVKRYSWLLSLGKPLPFLHLEWMSLCLMKPLALFPPPSQWIHASDFDWFSTKSALPCKVGASKNFVKGSEKLKFYLIKACSLTRSIELPSTWKKSDTGPTSWLLNIKEGTTSPHVSFSRDINEVNVVESDTSLVVDLS